MPNDVKKKFAEQLRQLIGNAAVVDLGDSGGPSRSYIYRMLKGTTNPSLEEMDAVLRAYGSSLGEFFESWTHEARITRQTLAAEARLRLESVLESAVDLDGLVKFLRVLDPEKRSGSKRH
jgi:transcriptional regulator with XRE-family HTH domain